MDKIPDRRLAWGFGIALLVLAANALISYRDLAELYANARGSNRSRDVLREINGVMAAFKDAESARRGFFVDGNRADRVDFDRSAERALAELDRLHTATSEHPQQHRRCRTLEAEARSILVALRRSIGDALDRGPDLVRGGFSSDPIRERLVAFFGLAADIERVEQEEQDGRFQARRSYIARTYATFSLASTLALLLIASVYVLVRRHLADNRRAERTLQQSEERVRLLLDSAGEGVYGVDTEGLCTFCNPAGLQLFGLESADQILGENVHDLFHHTRVDGTPFPAEDCPIFRTFRNGVGTLGEEDIFWRADGTPLEVEYRAHPVRSGGETIGAVVTFVDAGPKIRAETESRLRDRALKSIAQGVFITDPQDADEPIIDINPSFERITGYARADVEGRGIDLLFGPETDEAAVAELRSAFRERRAAKVELVCYRKDGSTFWDALSIAPVERPDGRVSHYVGVVADVTARRRDEQRVRDSEGRLRLMIESVRDYAIFSIDLKGRVSSWNAGAERLFGFADSEILGQPADRLLAAEDRATGITTQVLEAAGATGRSAEERWLVRRDGSRFLASDLVTAVRDDSGRLLGYTKVARDITEPKRVEAELRAAKVAAEVANRAKSTFLANMSHELRTPLNAIIGYTEILKEEAEDRDLDDLMPDLRRVHAAGKHLLGLINDVLDLSKIEAGRMELYLESFDLAAAVRDVVFTVEPLAEKAGDRLRLDLGAGLGAMHADLTKVRQSLLNLLSNAIKFTEHGTIDIRARREPGGPAGPDWIVLEVADDGIGMTGEELGRLFRPFVQADASTTRKYGGTGLGLTITRRFCRMMGGEIAARSEPGLGSTFTIRLPADVPGRPGDRHAPPRVGPGSAEVDAPAILVVGDPAIDPDAIVAAGYRPERVDGPSEAAVLARSGRFAAAVVDPGAGGWPLIAGLAADPEVDPIPLALVAGLSGGGAGFALGASGYLGRPADPGEWAAAIDAHRPDDPSPLAMVVDDDPAARAAARASVEGAGWWWVESADGPGAVGQAERVRPDLVVLDLTAPRADGFDFAARFRASAGGEAVPILAIIPRGSPRGPTKVDSILAAGPAAGPGLDPIGEIRRVMSGRRPPAPAAAPARP